MNDQSKETELKPCPCCGGIFHREEGEKAWFHPEQPCVLRSVALYDSSPDFMESWNSRTPDTAQQDIESLLDSVNTAEARVDQLLKDKEDLLDALGALVNLKDHKEKHGKDSHYLTLQPTMWKAVRALLARLPKGTG